MAMTQFIIAMAQGCESEQTKGKADFRFCLGSERQW